MLQEVLFCGLIFIGEIKITSYILRFHVFEKSCFYPLAFICVFASVITTPQKQTKTKMYKYNKLNLHFMFKEIYKYRLIRSYTGAWKIF